MPISNNEALTRTIEHREIFHDEMLALVRRIMGGEMSPVMMAAMLVGLRVKKETIGEITAAAQVMREFSTKVVVAACGARVSKHGNRGVSSKSGSADVLEAMGVPLALPPEAIARCIDEVA